jgi:hypothetical protein
MVRGILCISYSLKINLHDNHKNKKTFLRYSSFAIGFGEYSFANEALHPALQQSIHIIPISLSLIYAN